VQQIINVWTGLGRRKQIAVVVASLAMFVSVLAMSRMATNPTMALLFAGLENDTAGDTVRALEQRNVLYEVRGGSIYVPAAQRDELRMTMASEGLPANGGRGYELLDSLSGFGTTSQMFDAAYWRAKEGELARTIVTSPHISQARVHIANSGSNPFRQSVDVTASVSVVPAGAPITGDQANALRYLIASAVAGLTVENVAVIDAKGALIGSAETANSASTAEDRAKTLRDRVLRLVEARVGAGNAVVEVSVETVTETESIRERRFDPESRVAISTDVEERADSSSNQAGDVTVASNLPDGDGAGGEGNSAKNSSTRERINYEVSQTDLEIVRAPGAIKRLSVAVLVNGVTPTDPAADTGFAPRPAEEMAALQQLVESAVGFNAERGDVITLKSMELPAAEPLGTSAASSFFQRFQLDVMSLVQIGTLALVTLGLGLFVVRPILTNSANLSLPAPETLSAVLSGTSPNALDEPVHIGEIDDGQAGQFTPSPGLLNQSQSGTDLAAISGTGENPVDRLRALIGERQEETVEILRGWLEESEESA